MWLGFGVFFILRFVFLLIGPRLFCATAYPLWYLSPNILNISWLCLFIYWLFFSIGYAISNRKKRSYRIRYFLSRLDMLNSLNKLMILDFLAITTLCAIVVVFLFTEIIPKGLITPLGHYGSFYVIPLTVSWFLYYQGEKIGIRRFIYIIPGTIIYVLNPYREYLLVLFLCILLPLLIFIKKISLKKVVLMLLIILISSTILTNAYRMYRSGQNFRLTFLNTEIKEMPLVRLIKRIHAFDSIVLTVFAVPQILPFSNRNIISEFIIQITPKFIYYSKKSLRQARIFSIGVWALDESGNIEERPSAMIAPSMVGDLYSINGILIILIGAFIWGIFIGCFEFLGNLSGYLGKLIFLILFGPKILFSLERDFINNSATVIQLFIILLFVIAFFPFRVIEKRN